MTITLEGAALACMGGVILLFMIGAGAAAIMRERTRQRESKENKEKELLGAIQSVHSAMQVVCERVAGKSELERDKHIQMLGEIHEISKLVLDVEKRLTQQVEETRAIIRSHSKRDAVKVFNTNADGGQTNQGGSVRGEQR